MFYLPVFVLMCYLIYRFFKWFCCTVLVSPCRRHQPVEEEGEVDEQQPLLPPTHTEDNIAKYTSDDLFVIECWIQLPSTSTMTNNK